MKPVVFKLSKTTKQNTGRPLIRKQLALIKSKILSSGRASTWNCRASLGESSFKNGLYHHQAEISVNKTSGHAKTVDSQLAAIRTALSKVVNHTTFGQYPWSVEGFDDPKKTKTSLLDSKKYFEDLNITPKEEFSHIYDRDHQIRILLSSIEEAIDSNFQNRFHCLLYGPPGCAKTDIMRSCGKMLGPENEAYLMFDATSTTEAGVYSILANSEHIPPVLFVEEPEKADEKSLRWLLGIMDQRAEIRRTNYRTGNGVVRAKMLVVAAVNDVEQFKRVMSGALLSRFAHEIYCPTPSQKVLRKILEREVSKKNGRKEWIQPTLDFCEEVKISDPRKVIPICLCGKDQLLDGSFQESLKAVSLPIGI